MSADSVKRYIEIKRQITELEKEMDDLKDSVFAAVDKKGGEVEEGAFVIRSYKKPKYKFSEKYEKKNNELKQLRQSEIDRGDAKVDGYSEYVVVRTKSEKS